MGLMERAKLLKRRGGNGGSDLALRYLAAIEGDAVELLLPLSPAASSHATKHTARTVGESSASFYDNGTNTSSNANGGSPNASRHRKRLLPSRRGGPTATISAQQQQQCDEEHQQQLLNTSDDLSTPASMRRREQTNSSSIVGTSASSSAASMTPPRRGFFRALRHGGRNNEGATVGSDVVVASDAAVATTTATSTMGNGSGSRAPPHQHGTPPRRGMRYPVQQQQQHRAAAHNQSNHNPHDHQPLDQSDETSSLSSDRRDNTSESAFWSPQVRDWKLLKNQQRERNGDETKQQQPQSQKPPPPSPCHNRTTQSQSQSAPASSAHAQRGRQGQRAEQQQQQYPSNHPLRDHFDDTSSMGSSSGGYTGASTTSQDFTSLQNSVSTTPTHPQQQQRPPETLHSTTLSPIRPFSMERTFDTAVEKGLDLLLSTNAWACANNNNNANNNAHAKHGGGHGRNRQAASGPTTQLSDKTASTPAAPMAATTTATPRLRRPEMKYSPQRRKLVSEAAATPLSSELQPSLSAETPRSDYTGASTEIATNRAVDLAMKRIREIESGMAYNSNTGNGNGNSGTTSVTKAQTHSRAMSTIRDEELRMAAKSILSVSSTESSLRSNGNNKTTAIQQPLYHEQAGAERGGLTMGKLGLHVEQRQQRQQQQQQQQQQNISAIREEEDASISLSSVGADIEERNVYQMAKSSLRSVAGTKRKTVEQQQQPPLLASSVDPDESNDDSSRGLDGIGMLPSNMTNTNMTRVYKMPKSEVVGGGVGGGLGRIETRTFRVGTPAGGVPFQHSRPMPSQSPFDGIDACVSPPHIIRKMHSYEDVSPDPIFCSKSMSMSVHSSQMVSPRPASPFSSVDASFQSDNAMFMEKESCSSVAMSNSVNAETEHPSRLAEITAGRSYDTLKLRWENNYDGRPVGIKQQLARRTVDSSEERFGSRAPIRKDTHSHISGSNMTAPRSAALPEVNQNYDGILSSNDEPAATRLAGFENNQESQDADGASLNNEVLGIRGGFPRERTFEEYSYSKDQTSHSEPTSAAPTKSFDESVMSRSSNNRLVPLVPLELPSSRTSTARNKGVANAFLTAIASKSSAPWSRNAPDDNLPSAASHPTSSLEQSAHGGLNEKMSRATKAARCLDIDVDVKSLRSTFESIISPIEADDADEDGDDDDTASVKSLRERFEPSVPPPAPVENGISKTRALFEAKKSVAAKPFQVSNSNLKETFSKFESKNAAPVRGQRQPVASTQQQHLISDNQNGDVTRSQNEKTESPFSVADRIRAYTSDKEAKRTPSTVPTDKPATATSQSFYKTKPSESASSAHRAARQKMLTWRALRNKTAKFGAANDPSTDKRSEPNREATPDEPQVVPRPLPMRNSQSSLKVAGAATPNNDGSLPRASNGVDPTDVDVAIKSCMVYDNRKRLMKPTWLAQREKILSRARPDEKTPVSSSDVHAGLSLVDNPLVESANKQQATDVFEEHETQREQNPSDTIEMPADSSPKVADMDDIPNVISVSTDAQAPAIEEMPSSNVVLAIDEPQRGSTEHNQIEVQREASDKDLMQQPDTTVPITDEADADLVAPVHEGFGSEEVVTSSHSPEHRGIARSTPTQTLQTVMTIETGAETQTHPDVPIARVNSLVRDEKKESTPDDFDKVLDQKLGVALEKALRQDLSMPSFRDSSNFIAEPIASKGTESNERPVVIKPVARKPYVRPVAIKPVVKPVPIMPFARTTNPIAPTASKSNSNREYEMSTQAYVPGSTAMDDPLALPTLVAEIIKPFSATNVVDTTSEDSEFSDGVTLDLSIAEVSNLTNPTALVSRAEGMPIEWGQTPSAVSEDDEQTSDDRSKAKSVDLEAKRSEASSSQTSEAAAPLIAKALRAYPLSDDFSAESFFRARVVLAKQLWNDNSGHTRVKATSSPFATTPVPEEATNEEKIDEVFPIESNNSWDAWHVESSFPVGSTAAIEEKPTDDWNPFPSDRVESPVVTAVPEERPASVTPSRSKTPTRGNTSKSAPKNVFPSPAIRLPTLNTVESLGKLQYGRILQSSVPHSDPRTYHASQPVRSSELSLPFKQQASVIHEVPPPTSATTPSGQKTYGPKHVALLARIHALKEARLRRAAAIYNSTGFSGATASATPIATGGSRVSFTSLEVD